MRRVLFLDIDGVLNSAAWFDAHNSSGGIIIVTTEDYPLGHLDPAPIGLLNQIVEATGCEIVISSTWRLLHTVYEIAQMLAARGFKYPKSVVSKTPDKGGERGIDIAAWLSKNIVDSFVILDDDDDMVGLQKFQVHTELKFGLTPEDAEAAIEMLLNPD